MRKKSEKPFTQRTFNLPLDLIEQLDAYSNETGVAKSYVVTKAVQEYLIKQMERMS